VPGLDSYQPAEAVPEHKDGPDPQRATGGKENNAKPAYAIRVKDPEALPVCGVRRKHRRIYMRGYRERHNICQSRRSPWHINVYKTPDGVVDLPFALSFEMAQEMSRRAEIEEEY
jgi:hypothetical protein